MFAAVILKQSKEKIVVPIKWIAGLDIVQIFNRGISHTKCHLIFHSMNRDEEPNFTAEMKQKFDGEGSFCYEGKVLHVWGELIEIDGWEKINEFCFYVIRYV